MYINGNKHPILWWICIGIPFVIYSSFPRSIKRKLFDKYSSYGKYKNNNYERINDTRKSNGL